MYRLCLILTVVLFVFTIQEVDAGMVIGSGGAAPPAGATKEDFAGASWTAYNGSGTTALDVGTSVSNTATFTAITNGNQPLIEQSWLYNDRGAGNIGDFTYRFKFSTSTGANSGAVAIWGVTDTAGAFPWAAGVTLVAYGTNGHLYFTNYNWSSYSDYTGFTINTTYYAIVVRSGTTITMRLYDSEANALANDGSTGLLHGYSTITDGTAYRYVYAVASYNQENAAMTVTGLVGDFYIDAD